MIRIEDPIRFHIRFTMVNTWIVPIWLELNDNYAYAMCSTCQPNRITAEWLSSNLRYFRLLMVLFHVLRWKVWRILDTQKMTATEGQRERERECFQFQPLNWFCFRKNVFESRECWSDKREWCMLRASAICVRARHFDRLIFYASSRFYNAQTICNASKM